MSGQHAPAIPEHGEPVYVRLPHAGKMQYAYQTTDGHREYHRVYDFHIDRRTVPLDFVPFAGFHLALQRSQRRFVAAFLMLDHASPVAVHVAQNNPPMSYRHDGKNFLHLSFTARAPFEGIPLLACYAHTFIVRVITAEKAGTDFFLMVEGRNFAPNDPRRERYAHPRYEYDVMWTGSNQRDRIAVEHGRMTATPYGAFELMTRGPPFLPPPPNRGGQRGDRGGVGGGGKRRRFNEQYPPLTGANQTALSEPQYSLHSPARGRRRSRSRSPPAHQRSRSFSRSRSRSPRRLATETTTTIASEIVDPSQETRQYDDGYHNPRLHARQATE